MHATHTHLEMESLANANLPALLLDKHGKNITPPMLFNLEPDLKSKMKSKHTDQQKLPSPSMLTS